MASYDINKGARISFLLSLTAHAVAALVLGLILLEQPREKATESLAVDMVRTAKRVIPPRRIELLESTSDFRSPRGQRAEMQFKPRKLVPADIDTNSTGQLHLSDMTTTLPELATNADRLKSRFDTPLPRATGDSIIRPGTGSKRSVGERSGAASIGLPGGAHIFETALYWIARNITSRNKTGKEDIVLLIDASGTMGDNIVAVARYLSSMIDVLEESELDYTIGVIRFNRVGKNNIIKVYKQTRDVSEVKKILRSIKCDYDERAFDAIEVGLAQVEFRHPVDKTFILVTDETFLPRTLTRRARKGISRKEMLKEDFQEIVRMCKSSSIKVNVMGIDDEMHKLLAKETRGLWFQIPQQDGLP